MRAILFQKVENFQIRKHSYKEQEQDKLVNKRPVEKINHF